MSSMYTEVRYDIVKDRGRRFAARATIRLCEVFEIIIARGIARDNALSLPAYKNHDRRNHRGEEDETAEHSQSDDGT